MHAEEYLKRKRGQVMILMTEINLEEKSVVSFFSS